jgi:hypothetical protein
MQVLSRPLQLAYRQTIEQAVVGLDVRWNGGPYAEQDVIFWPGRTADASGLRAIQLPARPGLAGWRALFHHARRAPSGNLLRTPAGLSLVDWDVITLARLERDLWWVI